MNRRQHVSLLIAAVAVLPFFASCDLSADFWDERVVSINIPAGGPTSASSDDQLVDISQDPEIKDKVNQLKDVDVAEIWLYVQSIDPSNQTTSATGDLQVRGPNDSDQWIPVQGTINGTTEKTVSVNIAQDVRVEVVPDQAVVTQIKDWLLHGGKFHVRYNGSVNALPADFQVKARIHIVATAGT